MQLNQPIGQTGLQPDLRTGGPKSRSFLGDIRHNPFSYLIILPAIVYTVLFGYLTIPYMLIAFQDYNYQTTILSIFTRGKWVGFKNFQFFFATPAGWNVTRNTIVLNIMFIFGTMLFSVGIALLLNEVRGRKILKPMQSAMLLPHFLSWMMVSYIVYALLNSEYGAFNRILDAAHISHPNNWYSKADAWPWILTVIKIWKGAGYGSIVYLAAIAGIDEELYEAARIDGANRWRQLIHITLPLLMPTVCIMMIMSIGGIFRGDFGMTYAIIRDNGLLYRTTDVIDTYVYRALRSTGNPSMTMAIGLYQSFFGFLFVFGSNLLVKKVFKEGALF